VSALWKRGACASLSDRRAILYRFEGVYSSIVLRLNILLGALVGALAFISLAVAGGTSSKASLTVVSLQPLTVHGRQFVPRERVRVTFKLGKAPAHALLVRTSAAGTFATSAPAALRYDRCTTTLVVSAVGTRGDKALLKRPARGCAPAGTA
jgi:hypothetical protein